MDAEKKLQVAKTILKKFITGDTITDDEILREFPDLAESEDEKIRKSIINYFECQKRDEPGRIEILNKWISYLEKLNSEE